MNASAARFGGRLQILPLTRNYLGLMSGMGADQRAIEQAYAMAPLAQLQSLGQLYGTTPYNLFSGQNVTRDGTMQGTNVTRQSPSLFDSMLAAAAVGAKFIPV